MIDTDQIELDYRSGYRFSSQSNRWNVIPDLIAEVKRLRKQLLRGMELMNDTPTQTKDGRRYYAKRFEQEVREMVE